MFAKRLTLAWKKSFKVAAAVVISCCVRNLLYGTLETVIVIHYCSTSWSWELTGLLWVIPTQAFLKWLPSEGGGSWNHLKSFSAHMSGAWIGKTPQLLSRVAPQASISLSRCFLHAVSPAGWLLGSWTTFRWWSRASKAKTPVGARVLW